MNRLKLPSVAIAPFLLAPLLFSLTSCAPSVGPSVGVPDIPASSQPDADSARAKPSYEQQIQQIAVGGQVSLGEFRDTRETYAISTPSADQAANITQPQGPVSEKFTQALAKALEKQGIAVVPSAPFMLQGEIRKWQTSLVAKATTKLDSQAQVYVEVVSANLQRYYSGSFNGSRSSQFPIASTEDIQTSLGLAMASAIEQISNDPEVRAAAAKPQAQTW